MGSQTFNLTTALYDATVGFGLLTPGTPDEPRTFNANGGWISTGTVPALVARNEGVFSLAAGVPVIFGADVAELGNYKVTITIAAADQPLTNLQVTLGRRHLIARALSVAPHTTTTIHGVVHLGPYVQEPGGKPATSHLLAVSVYSLDGEAGIKSVTITPAKVPTLFIAGDSIAADNEAGVPYTPSGHGCGFGQQLELVLHDVAVDNQAHNGMTSQTFIDCGHWQLILNQLQPGDIVMWHFGHNDQKRMALQPFSGYATNLRNFITTVRKAQAQPLLVTSLSRLPTTGPDGRFDYLDDYAASIRHIGKLMHVPVIDLHQLSFTALCQLQDQLDLHRYFIDGAHPNDAGAGFVATWIAQLLLATPNPLTPYVTHTPMLRLDQPTEAQQQRAEAQPLKKNTGWDRTGLTHLDAFTTQAVTWARQLGLIDPTVPFYPDKPLSRGEFLYLLPHVLPDWHNRYYVADYADVDADSYFAPYVQAAADLHLLDAATMPKHCVRLADALTPSELFSILMRSRQPLADRNLSLSDCLAQAQALELLWPGFAADGSLPRLQIIKTLAQLFQTA